MKTAFRKLLTATVMATALVAAPLALAKDDAPAATTMVTVYVSAHGGSGMAKEANASHAKMEAQGWRFANFTVHAENGDTEGAWITYVK
ncbi:MAG: hypothetical protein KA224_06300 [Steroidobacteraceae bacterium]|nr:hypothetical protein [Steroidobacteraceae bacterium]